MITTLFENNRKYELLSGRIGKVNAANEDNKKIKSGLEDFLKNYQAKIKELKEQFGFAIKLNTIAGEDYLFIKDSGKSKDKIYITGLNGDLVKGLILNEKKIINALKDVFENKIPHVLKKDEDIKSISEKFINEIDKQIKDLNIIHNTIRPLYKNEFCLAGAIRLKKDYLINITITPDKKSSKLNFKFFDNKNNKYKTEVLFDEKEVSKELKRCLKLLLNNYLEAEN